MAWTEQASGALLPGGGAGGLAIGGWLIHLTGAPTKWIVRRSGGLFFLTTAVNAATVTAAGLALIAGAPGPHDLACAVLPTMLVAASTLAVAALPKITRTRPGTPRWIRAISAGVQNAEQTTFQHPSWRLAGGLGYLGFDIAVLWICLTALGPAPSLPTVVLAYNIGYIANALPIPGGIGALDAGRTGALIVYGIAPAHAAAAVLVYHTIALWIPGLGGLLAYSRLRPRLVKQSTAGVNSSQLQTPPTALLPARARPAPTNGEARARPPTPCGEGEGGRARKLPMTNQTRT
jgi:uncharacterized membrane protein YbhN (UPF0104 family)